jgi:pimeloyl-ACP methyl ester carboxylesterase
MCFPQARLVILRTLRDKSFRLVLGLALLALLASSTAPALARPAPLPAAQEVVPRFEPDTCWFELPRGETAGETLVCGWLVVPEEHGVAGSLTLKLAVVLIRSITFQPPAEPVVFLPDQPGQGAIDTQAAALLNHPMRDLRHLVVFDPRGTGRSQPALLCPEVRAAQTAQFANPADPAAAAANYNRAALACRERLVQSGVNLSAYNTLEAAADLEDLRRALGFSQLYLYAPGYGGRVALNAVRDNPAGLGAVVLDGPLTPQNNLLTEAPANADFAFTEFFAACVQIARCSAWYRQVEREMANTVDLLNNRPAALTLVDPYTGLAYPMQLTGDALVGYVLQLMARTEALPLIPELIYRAANRQFGPLVSFISSVEFDPTFAPAAYWSAVCAEDGATQAGPPNVSQLRRWVHYQAAGIQAAFELCQQWRVRSVLPRATQTPVSSTVPALVLNGNFDPLSPRRYGDTAAGYFNQAAHAVFLNAGHNSYPASGDCAAGLVEDFWETPGLPVRTGCVAEVPAVRFVIPPEVIEMPVRGLYNDLRAQQPRTLLWLAFLGLSTSFLLSALIVFPLASLFGKKGEELEMPAFPTEIPSGMPAMPTAPPDMSQAGSLLPRAAPWLVVLFGLGVLALGVAFPLLVAPALESGAPITWVGLPASLAWYAIVPAALLLLAVLLLVSTVALWLDKAAPRGRKFYHALLLFAALLALGLLIGAGALQPAWVYISSSVGSSLGTPWR